MTHSPVAAAQTRAVSSHEAVTREPAIPLTFVLNLSEGVTLRGIRSLGAMGQGAK